MRLNTTKLRPIVLLLGDSLTQQGYNENGWCSHLSHHFRRTADVLNRGYNGYNTRWYKQVALEDTLTIVQNHECWLGTIFLGTNDAAVPGELQHVPLDEYRSHLETMVQQLRSQQRNLPIVILSPPPVDMERWQFCKPVLEKDPTYDASAVSQQYGRVAQTVADQNDCLFLDVFEALGGSNGREAYSSHLSDGLHLSQSGNRLVYQALVELLENHSLDASQLEYDEYYPAKGDTSALRRPKILLLGDSLTEFGYDRNGWVARLSNLYKRRADTLLRGFQGHNTRRAWDQFQQFLPSIQTTDNNVLFATLFLGANDAFLPGDDRHVPVEDYRDNLSNMIDHLR